jgi:hypothetical protein
MDIDLLLKRESTEKVLQESGITDDLCIEKTTEKAVVMQTQVSSQHLLREVLRILTNHKRGTLEQIIMNDSGIVWVNLFIIHSS